MTTQPLPVNRWPILRFKTLELELRPRVFVALGIAVVIIVIAVVATPGFEGWAVGIGTVLGAVLGILIQVRPIPTDYNLQATSAIRGLLSVVEAIEDTQIVATQLAEVKTNQRVNLGLVGIQDDLLKVRLAVYEGMSEWDAIAPGSFDKVIEQRRAGALALDRLSRSNDNE